MNQQAPQTSPQPASPRDQLEQVIAQANTVILGKDTQIRLALACLLARGHLLIEDLPGLGKTTLAHVLARVLGLQFNRIQFTSDMLPADILGVSIFDRRNSGFEFHPGPIFAQLVLADEVNRATPKAQSALLEAMEERQVTIENETRALPVPFFVIATQNPHHLVGTFPLPESQLDRFLMRIEMGYPGVRAERELLTGRDRRDVLAELKPAMTSEDLMKLQAGVTGIHVSETLLDYLQAIIDHSRQSADYETGLSPRAGMALLHGAQAWALMHGRDHVQPEDLQAVLPGVVGHRLQVVADYGTSSKTDPVTQLLETVPIPR